MKDLFFYDAMCSVGCTRNGGRAPSTPAELFYEMDHYGIDKALIQHANIACAGAVFSNQWVADFVAQDTSDRLRGVWCILPDQTCEVPLPLYDRMKENKIAALTMHPADHRWIISKRSIGKVMGEAADRKIPMLLTSLENNFSEIYHLVDLFPDNIFIVHKTSRHGFDRELRPLLDQAENVYLSLSAYWVPEGIRDLAELYGADRILYGSAFPVFNHGSMMLPVKHSGLSESDIAKIAGGNLERLLKEAWK